MNELTIFNNAEFGEIRIIEVNGTPYFVGKDVATALGYAKPENAISNHVDDEDKTTTLIQGTGSNYKSKAVIINESGLYSLILSSKLPTAKKFKHWVTSEVLPAIRKTGGYNKPNSYDKAKALEIRMMNAKVKMSNQYLKLASVDTLSEDWKKILVSKSAEVLSGEKLLPLPESEKTYSATDIADMFGVSAQKIGKIANANNMKTSEYGKFYKDKSRYSNKEVDTFRYNEKAIDKFKEILS